MFYIIMNVEDFYYLYLLLNVLCKLSFFQHVCLNHITVCKKLNKTYVEVCDSHLSDRIILTSILIYEERKRRERERERDGEWERKKSI